MRRLALCLGLTLLCSSRFAFCASKSMSFECSGRSVGHFEYRTPHRCPHPFLFRIEVVTDEPGASWENVVNGRPILTVRENQSYSIRIHNPLPVRVAVNLTVDGLSTIDGRPCSAGNGAKWILEPRSYAKIDGWQVGPSSARRFVFTSKESSYARWRSNPWGPDLAANCGVIGAAYFWSVRELQSALAREHRKDEHRWAVTRESLAPGASALSEKARPLNSRAADFEAGTGMGERLTRPVEMVDFHYDAGMYNPREAVLLFYDFPRDDAPHPLLDRPIHTPPGGFAPEMPGAFR